MNESQTAKRKAHASPDGGAGRAAALLAAGRALFATRPYDELSVDEIAREAGVAKGLLYYYFGSKRGLYLAVVARAAEELRARVDQDATLPPLERLTRGLDAYLSYAEESPAGYRALMSGGIGSDAEVKAIVTGERARFLALIADALGLPGEPRSAVAIAVEGWFSYIEGACLEWLARGGLSREGLRTLLVEVLGGALAAAQAADPGVRMELGRLQLR